MGFSAQLLTFLVVLALVSLSSFASNVAQSRSAPLHLGDVAGSDSSASWNVLRSQLRDEVQAEAMELWEVLRRDEGGSGVEMRAERGSGLQGHISEGEKEGDEQEERHPGEELLQRHKADATISYILGGY